jgi:hypothetical protein
VFCYTVVVDKATGDGSGLGVVVAREHLMRVPDEVDRQGWNEGGRVRRRVALEPAKPQLLERTTETSSLTHGAAG